MSQREAQGEAELKKRKRKVLHGRRVRLLLQQGLKATSPSIHRYVNDNRVPAVQEHQHQQGKPGTMSVPIQYTSY